MDVVEKKEIVHEYDQCDHNPYWGRYGWNYREPASKGVAGAGLGLGIAGTALGLLALSGRGLFGLGGNTGAGQIAYDYATNSNLQYVERKQCQDYIDLTKEFYQGRINEMRELSEAIYTLEGKLNNSSFSLYKNQRDQFDSLSARIGKLETEAAVNAAVDPWRSKVLQMQIGNVAGLVELEAERRACADNKIVNYANNTFYPVNVANVTVGTTSTPRSIYNPLCPCPTYITSASTTTTSSAA